MNKIRLLPGLLILISPVIPWTVAWGSLATGGSTYFWYELDFPFAAYLNIVGNTSGWILYTPLQYLGVALATLGGTFVAMSTVIKGRESMLRIGGFMSIAGPLIFASSYSGLYQTPERVMNFIAFPVGSFAPIIFGAIALVMSVSPIPAPRPIETPTSAPPISIPEPQLPPGSAPAFCPRCGYKLPEEAVYCLNCGFKVRR